MPSSPASLRRLVLETAAKLGFDRAGVASVVQFPALRHFADWILNGHAGSMNYLARRRDPANRDSPFLREDIRHAFPWARSVVCCATLYNTPHPRSTDARDPDRGWISRYAWGDDYHEILLQKTRTLAQALEAELRDRDVTGAPDAQARCYVDTGPIVERAAAQAAGIGWIGKNTCLLDQNLGSWFFLSTLICSAEIEPDSPVADRCGSCTRCLDACPTGALDPATPYRMDASRCIAYLNIELRGDIPEPLRPGIQSNVFGCDICQDVCPWNGAENGRAPFTLQPAFEPRPGTLQPRLEDLARMSEDDYRRLFRHSAVKRAKYQGFMRNVAVAIGNSGQPELAAALQPLRESPDPVVRDHAEWAYTRLSGQQPPSRS
jgi:epoxyqueuosine reductase